MHSMKYEIDSIKKEQIYQHTGIMILIKAVQDVYGKTSVVVGNSLNQGFFIYLGNTDKQLTNSDIDKIREKMNALVAQDIPIVEKWMPNREAVKIWRQNGFTEKARLFEGGDPEQQVVVYELDGYCDYFYSDMLPSTGYYELFELRKYKNGMLLRNPCVPHPDSIPPYRDDDKLYEAFADSKKMRKSFNIDYLADLNEKSDEEVREIIIKSEELQRKEINEIAQKIVDAERRIVLVAGPSSSGKTTFAKKLCAKIGEISGVEPLYLGTDDYFIDRKDLPVLPDGTQDFEGLNAIDLKLFDQHMLDLLAGKEVDIPEYDFIDGVKKYGKRIVKPLKNQTMVIEGIHSLNDALTTSIPASNKFKVYISPLTRVSIDKHNRISTADARMFRRMVRDYQFRDRSAVTTIKDWPSVRAGETNNIFPYSSMADVVFNSSLVYETALLKHYARPLLEEITEDMPEYEEAKRLLDFTNCFREIDLADAVPQDSILREFIGK